MNRIMLYLLLLAFGAGGGLLVGRAAGGQALAGLPGAIAGLAVAALALLAGRLLAKVAPRRLMGGAVGLLVGLALAFLIAGAVGARAGEGPYGSLGLFFLSLLLGYLGLSTGFAPGFSLGSREPQGDESPEPRSAPSDKILDTSAIIDGRIADICETGFLEGTFIVPQFVLRELQHIADSSDTLKRNRGRRGLDILHRLQKKTDLQVKIVENDYPRVREVDGKLIAMAKEQGLKIITNDFNLNKIAELQGVAVLNINQLANALKPVVLPGEAMKVYILKEGKEANQGVAYLDDGTMVVVDNGKKEIGRTIDVLVTSVLQTTAGRMIFTQIKEEVPVRNGG